MSDLISRKALLDSLGKHFINVNYHPDLGDPCIGMEQELFNEFLVGMLEEVKNQPTAYDVDKVVEQLKEAEEEHRDECGFDLFDYIKFDTAIEIVKEGVVKDE